MEAALLLSLGSYILHALWRVMCSGSGVAVAAVGAGYLITAILSRAALPSLAGVALWLPLLYPYAWMGVSALLWFACTLEVGGVRAHSDERPSELTAYFHSQLALNVGAILLSLELPWQSWWLYLFFPPLLVIIGYFGYRMQLWRDQQRGQDAFMRCSSAVLAWLVPLAVLAVTARLTPLLLTLV
jgi:hypothetical protein